MQNKTKKVINASLIKNSNNEIVIRFYFENTEEDLNLQSNNSAEIKKVFLELSKQLRLSPIEINLEIDKSIDDNSDGLFMEAATEYIKQLNAEMLEIENDEDLKIIRDFNNKDEEQSNN